jgi:hypothetical protein
MAIIVRRLAWVSGVGRLDAKQAADPAEDATNRNPNHRANRTGSLGAHGSAVRRTIGNSLSLSRDRGGQ